MFLLKDFIVQKYCYFSGYELLVTICKASAVLVAKGAPSISSNPVNIRSSIKCISNCISDILNENSVLFYTFMSVNYPIPY